MNSFISLGAGALFIVGIASFAISRGSTDSAQSQTSSTPSESISGTATSEDAKEMFNIHIYEPWQGAGRRVVTITAASIDRNGFVRLTATRFCDLGSAVEPVVTGTRFRCKATVNVGSWHDVDSTEDVTLTLTAVE